MKKENCKFLILGFLFLTILFLFPLLKDLFSKNNKENFDGTIKVESPKGEDASCYTFENGENKYFSIRIPPIIGKVIRKIR